ncbi:hypothetical protein F2Q69_00047343 [Brassica cretica]|uniref:Uncharacterized protein n=1 Tax=Brassica cretica TaxID=69181 RepID=A0A8S9PEL7_BRACR|nr:hypothetical protein F2Q69_00047343 [Brassica cretica]
MQIHETRVHRKNYVPTENVPRTLPTKLLTDLRRLSDEIPTDVKQSVGIPSELSNLKRLYNGHIYLSATVTWKKDAVSAPRVSRAHWRLNSMQRSSYVGIGLNAYRLSMCSSRYSRSMEIALSSMRRSWFRAREYKFFFPFSSRALEGSTSSFSSNGGEDFYGGNNVFRFLRWCCSVREISVWNETPFSNKCGREWGLSSPPEDARGRDLVIEVGPVVSCPPSPSSEVTRLKDEKSAFLCRRSREEY